MRTLSVDFSHVVSPPESLAGFLRRVWHKQVEVRESLAPEPVHDLRVALRRCSSLAEGFSALDNHRDWGKLRKAAKQLQSGLAKLRDAQVMARGVRRLRLTDGAAGAVVVESLRREERKARRAARSALADFPRKRWKRWQRRLPKRAERIPNGPASFADLALKRVAEAVAREGRWRGTESQVAAHSLRIAVKHFRYMMESLLPEQYAAWEQDLKRMQDCLGEMHDLDVLRGWILRLAKEESLSERTVRTWLRRIEIARESSAERYRKVISPKAKTVKRGKHAPVLWDRWRHELYSIAWINPPTPAKASGLEAIATAPSARKPSADRGKRLPLS